MVDVTRLKTRRETGLDHIEHPIHRAFIRCWSEFGKHRQRPNRHDLDPCVMGPQGILPRIWLADRCDGDFVYRLTGAEIAAAWQNDRLAGRSITELLPESAISFVLGNWNRVLDRGVMLHTIGQVYTALDRYRVGERVVLPLAADNRGIEAVVGVTVYGDEQKLEANRPHNPALQVDVMTETPIESIWELHGAR